MPQATGFQLQPKLFFNQDHVPFLGVCVGVSVCVFLGEDGGSDFSAVQKERGREREKGRERGAAVGKLGPDPGLPQNALLSLHHNLFVLFLCFFFFCCKTLGGGGLV